MPVGRGNHIGVVLERATAKCAQDQHFGTVCSASSAANAASRTPNYSLLYQYNPMDDICVAFCIMFICTF